MSDENLIKEAANKYGFNLEFFNWNDKELKKASRNDDENNFYKSQLQVIAIGAFLQNDTESVSYINPLIVTNAINW